jgi:hypothetical protein
MLVPDWTGTPDGCPTVWKRWGLAVSRAARGRETVPIRFTGCARKWGALSAAARQRLSVSTLRLRGERTN